MKMQRKTSSADTFFKKPRFYGLVHIKMELINTITGTVTISFKILEVNFGNSLNDSKWERISNSIAKKPLPRTE